MSRKLSLLKILSWIGLLVTTGFFIVNLLIQDYLAVLLFGLFTVLFLIYLCFLEAVS